MADSMLDLEVEIQPDGSARLTQGFPEGTIDLHPSQLRLIAERAGLITESDGSTAWPRNFARRLYRIREEAGHLADLIAAVPCFPPQDAMTEDERAAHELWQRIDDLIEDYEVCTSAGGSGRNAERVVTRQGVTPVTPVTPSSTSTSSERPAKTNAERQAAFRDRQKRLALEEKAPNDSPSGA